MLSQAVKAGVPSKHVLFDIWIYFPVTIIEISKSYLNLDSEFQQLSYDAITAHTTVILIIYMILTLEKRQSEDPRALGEIFFLCYDEMADMQFAEAFELILSLLKSVLEDCMFLTNEQISQLIVAFILKLPLHYKQKIWLNSQHKHI